jgi:hypothetical protein
MAFAPEQDAGISDDFNKSIQSSPELDYISEILNLDRYTNQERRKLALNVRLRLHEFESILIKNVYSPDVEIACYSALMLGKFNNDLSVRCLVNNIVVKEKIHRMNMALWLWGGYPAAEGLQSIGIRAVSPLVARLQTSLEVDVRDQCSESLAIIASDRTYGAAVTTAILQDALSKTTDPRATSNLRAAATFVQQRIDEHQKSMAKVRRSANEMHQ